MQLEARDKEIQNFQIDNGSPFNLAKNLGPDTRGFLKRKVSSSGREIHSTFSQRLDSRFDAQFLETETTSCQELNFLKEKISSLEANCAKLFEENSDLRNSKNDVSGFGNSSHCNTTTVSNNQETVSSQDLMAEYKS